MSGSTICFRSMPRHVRAIGSLVLALATCWPQFAHAAEPQALSSTPPQAFLTREGPLPARLVGIDREANVSLAIGGKVRVVPARELAYWGRYRDTSAGPQVLLIDGSLIRADVLKIDVDALVVGDATGLGRGLWEDSTLPRTSVRAVLFQPPAGAADRDRLLAQLAEPIPAEAPRESERLWLVGGESIEGSLVAAPLAGSFVAEDVPPGQEVFRWQSAAAAEPLEVPAAKVLAWSRGATEFRPPTETTSLWLGCREGSLLHVSAVQTTGDKLDLALVAGGSLATTLRGRDDPEQTFWDDVTLVQPRGSSSLVWLTDEASLGYKHIPFLSLARPYSKDKSVTGSRLRSGGGVYLKGLGMHTTSRLAYGAAGYRSFVAELALDESAGLAGSVIFRVLLQDPDGSWRAGYVSEPIRGGEAPLPIEVDLQGAARIALIVEFADRGDVLDHANWLSARLVK
jgi:hypothetical protein